MEELLVEHRMVVSACTDIGNRQKNQDGFIVDDIKATYSRVQDHLLEEVVIDGESFYLAVFDGIGGTYAGEEAVQVAIETTMQENEKLHRMNLGEFDGDILKSYLNTLNNQVVDYYRGQSKSGGTTVAFACLMPMDDYMKIGVCNVGDSPIYVLRDKHLIQLTIEHTVAYAKILNSLGEPTKEDENCLINYIGKVNHSGYHQAHIEEYEFYREDRLLICSDGISKYLTQEEIIEILSESEDAARDLVARAKMKNNLELDNLTAISVKFLENKNENI